MSDIVAEKEGRHLLFKVGAKYSKRTLVYAIENALRGKPLNGEQRLELIKIRIAIELQERKEQECTPETSATGSKATSS